MVVFMLAVAQLAVRMVINCVNFTICCHLYIYIYPPSISLLWKLFNLGKFFARNKILCLLFSLLPKTISIIIIHLWQEPFLVDTYAQANPNFICTHCNWFNLLVEFAETMWRTLWFSSFLSSINSQGYSLKIALVPEFRYCDHCHEFGRIRSTVRRTDITLNIHGVLYYIAVSSLLFS